MTARFDRIAGRAWNAGVAELVDAPDLGSGAERRGGSSPFTRTIFACAMPPTNPSRGFDLAPPRRTRPSDGVNRAKISLNDGPDYHFACKTFVNLHKAVHTNGRLRLI